MCYDKKKGGIVRFNGLESNNSFMSVEFLFVKLFAKKKLQIANNSY